MKATLYTGTPQEVSLEGSPGEIADTLRMLNSPQEGQARATPILSNSSNSSSRDEEYVNVTIARRAMTRRPLTNAVLRTLRTLYRKYPELVSARELAADVSYSGAQFGGLLGAFGRRVSHTPGYEGEASFFVQEWDASEGCWRYSLPDSVREAMRLEGLT